MLEVCFSDSVKGALLYAQNCDNIISESFNVISSSKGIFSYFSKKLALRKYKKQRKELQRRAVSLGGKREDVVGISFSLSEGDIKSPIKFDDCPRKDYIKSVFSFDRYNENENMKQTINYFWRNCVNDLEKLKLSQDKIRIWLDRTPDAQCGLLFVANLLKNSNSEIYVIELPKELKQDNNSMIEYRSWGEVEPELYGTFLDREKKLSKAQINELSNQWEKLKEENAPLRVIENDVIISVDEDYYDDLIRKEFPKKTCNIAYIVGSALGKQKILTGDVFIAKRIQHFINTGELIVIDHSKDGFYATVVGCAK